MSREDAREDLLGKTCHARRRIRQDVPCGKRGCGWPDHQRFRFGQIPRSQETGGSRCGFQGNRQRGAERLATSLRFRSGILVAALMRVRLCGERHGSAMIGGQEPGHHDGDRGNRDPSATLSEAGHNANIVEYQRPCNPSPAAACLIGAAANPPKRGRSRVPGRVFSGQPAYPPRLCPCPGRAAV